MFYCITKRVGFLSLFRRKGAPAAMRLDALASICSRRELAAAEWPAVDQAL